jgi:hypothetical protein
MPTAIHSAYEATLLSKNVHAFERRFVALQQQDFRAEFVAIYDGELLGAYSTPGKAEAAVGGRSGLVGCVPPRSGTSLAPTAVRLSQTRPAAEAPPQDGDISSARPSWYGTRLSPGLKDKADQSPALAKY